MDQIVIGNYTSHISEAVISVEGAYGATLQFLVERV
jgi:hypothetical protein